AKRASLSDLDLGRLADALKEQIERYRVSMEIIPLTVWKHGTPLLQRFQQRLDEVNTLIAKRADDPSP
ncbi:MAG: hypothetical protein Q8Q79_07195, partial [Sphingopyxis sp.]|nr:hypothetical protein [Sphingopyxis sp.]